MLEGWGLMAAFLIAIALLLILIIKFHLNAFIALLTTTIATGLMVRMPIKDITSSITNGFGSTLGSIGVIIGLGVMLGRFLFESGGTDVMADTFLRKFGSKRSRLAVSISGFLTGIPVFGDIVHIMYAPMVRLISYKTSVPIISLVTAMTVSTVCTGALVIPTPNPMAVAEQLQLDVGVFFLYALITGFVGSLVGGVLYGGWIDKHDKKIKFVYDFKDLEEDEKMLETAKNSNRISFGKAISILLLPILLILLGSFGSLLIKDGIALTIISFIGNKNIAMLIGVIYAALISKPYLKKSVETVMSDSAAQVGLVLLITGSGGTFGKILQTTGIADYLSQTLLGFHVPVLVLCFIISQVLRCAQGSTGVALITTSSMLSSTIAASGISPVLCGIAICAGGIGLSLPNDSGFWAINRFYKISVPDTIRSWSIGGFIAGVTCLIFVCILSIFQGVLPGLL